MHKKLREYENFSQSGVTRRYMVLHSEYEQNFKVFGKSFRIGWCIPKLVAIHKQTLNSALET